MAKFTTRRKHRHWFTNGLSAAGRIASNYMRSGALKRRARTTGRTTTRMRKKFKGSGSRTLTKKKNRFSTATEDGFGGFKAVVFITHRHKKPVRFNKMTAEKFIYNSQVTNSISWVSGRQAVGTMFGLMNVSMMTLLNNHFFQGANNKFSTNIFVDKVTSICAITNASAAPCEVLVYTVISRKDNNGSGGSEFPDQLWYQGTTTNLEGDGGSVISGVSGNAGYWGATPNQASLFSAFYKVKTVKKAILAPGQTLKHTVVYKLRSMLPTETMVELQAVAGWTVYLMCVARSICVVEDTTPTIGFPEGKILYAANNAITSYSAEKGKTFSTATPFSSLSASNETLMNVDTGAVISGGIPHA